jgi:hypothetical protein
VISRAGQWGKGVKNDPPETPLAILPIFNSNPGLNNNLCLTDQPQSYDPPETPTLIFARAKYAFRRSAIIAERMSVRKQKGLNRAFYIRPEA